MKEERRRRACDALNEIEERMFSEPERTLLTRGMKEIDLETLMLRLRLAGYALVDVEQMKDGFVEVYRYRDKTVRIVFKNRPEAELEGGS